jgi:hypothetical protein
LIELFVDGQEDGLSDDGRLDELGLGDGSVVFMLHRLGWRWTKCSGYLKLSEDGLVATVTTAGEGWQLVTGGEPMTEGCHYWEVELTEGGENVMVGAVRPSQGHGKNHHMSNDAYFIDMGDGSLEGNGKEGDDEQDPPFAKGDRVGMLLDLVDGYIHVYRNGKRYGPGFSEGVKGPLVCAAAFAGAVGERLTVLPGAMAPEGAGRGCLPVCHLDGSTGGGSSDGGSEELAQNERGGEALPVGRRVKANFAVQDGPGCFFYGAIERAHPNPDRCHVHFDDGEHRELSRREVWS